jgi:lambda family phage minor tail protein L
MPRDAGPTFIEQKNLRVNQPIYLYEINFKYPENDPLNWLYFAGVNFNVDFGEPLKRYYKFPIEFDNVSENAQGEVDTVEVRVSNVSRDIQYYLEQYNALRGKKIIIKTVWANKLDDPDCYIRDVYYVSRVVTNDVNAIFTLTSKFDLMEVSLPRETYSRNFCRWQFISAECGYNGLASECNKTLNNCKLLGNSRRFGGFPSVPSRFIFV